MVDKYEAITLSFTSNALTEHVTVDVIHISMYITMFENNFKNLIPMQKVSPLD